MRERERVRTSIITQLCGALSLCLSLRPRPRPRPRPQLLTAKYPSFPIPLYNPTPSPNSILQGKMDSLAASQSTSSQITTTSSSSITDYSSSSGDVGGRPRGSGVSMVSDLVDKLICAIVTCVFTVVGSFAGAVTGGLIGLATESGLFRGAGIGAISGAIFSIEVVESSLALWHSNESGIWSILYVLDIISSLLSGRLVREKIGPAMQSAVQSQMSAVDSPFIESLDIFETGSTRGMLKDSVDKLPTIMITTENNVDASGDKICCSVCLQDFQIRETARSLPHCGHMFHLPCIDGWLIRHGSCPLCRRDLQMTGFSSLV